MKIEFQEQLWYDLEKLTPSFGSLTAKRIQFGSEILIAIDHDGKRHFLLPLEDLSEAVNDTRSRGISVKGRLLSVEDQQERPFLDILCTDKSGHKLFNLVITEILQYIDTGMGPAEAVSRTLNRWRKFWSGSLNQVLSEEQIKGLFGELWFLLAWLLPKGLNHIQHWVGPTGARHDFEWSRSAMEVKTTSSSRGHIHKIHGLDQLDPPECGNLYLFSLRLKGEGTASNTLPLLVEKITQLLKTEPSLLELFEMRLAQAGYTPAHDDHYMNYRYRVIDERVYIVNEFFPRLSLSSFNEGLPRGIERIDYEINLEACDNSIICTSPQKFEIDLS